MRERSQSFRSRNEVWIIGGGALAEAVRSRCIECCLKEQRMGPLPDHRVGPCPIFQSMPMQWICLGK